MRLREAALGLFAIAGCGPSGEAGGAKSATGAGGPPASQVAGFSSDAAATASGSLGASRPIALGLRGDVYFLPEGTDKLPDFSKLKPAGSVFASSLDVPAREFKEGFPGVTDRFEWFAIDYAGSFVAPKAGSYGFKLISDDGSKLLVDGKVVVDNDGVHGVSEADGSVDLAEGPHSLRVQYFQGPRYEIALRLLWAPPGGRLAAFDAVAARPAEVAKGKGKLRVTLGDAVMFDTGKSDLKPAADAVLASLKATVIDPRPGAKVAIEGHTDDVGDDASNDDLSVRRARAVAGWLTARGVGAGRMSVEGHGKRYPRVPNTSPENRAKNRRVEIVIDDDQA